MHVTSCFEDVFKRNKTVQSESEFEGRFENYNFLRESSKKKVILREPLRENYNLMYTNVQSN